MCLTTCTATRAKVSTVYTDVKRKNSAMAGIFYFYGTTLQGSDSQLNHTVFSSDSFMISTASTARKTNREIPMKRGCNQHNLQVIMRQQTITETRVR